MTVLTIADIVGDAAKHQISATSINARSVIFSVTGSGAARVGDTNVSSSRGAAVSAGATPLVLAPNPGDLFDFYDLSQLFAFIPSGATLSISYA